MRLATRNRILRLCMREEWMRAKGIDAALTYHVGNVSCLLRSVLRMLREVESCCRRCRNWSSARMFSAGSAIVPTRCSSRESCSRKIQKYCHSMSESANASWKLVIVMVLVRAWRWCHCATTIASHYMYLHLTYFRTTCMAVSSSKIF
jgi:hypothetical protein